MSLLTFPVSYIILIIVIIISFLRALFGSLSSFSCFLFLPGFLLLGLETACDMFLCCSLEDILLAMLAGDHVKWFLLAGGKVGHDLLVERRCHG
jgi:hypothetical protein